MKLLWLLLALASPLRAASSGTAVGDYELPQSTLTPHVEYRAEDVVLDHASGTLELRRHVWVKEEDWVLKSEEVHLDLHSRLGTATGYVLVETEGTALWGEEGDFDFANHSGTLYHANGGYDPWYIEAKSLQFEKGGPHRYKSVNLTTCSYVPNPHYYMHASKLLIKPNRWMLATNMVVFLGDVPVFYLPFFYSSLGGGEKHLSTHFAFGYSAHNGYEMKTTTFYRFSPYSYGRLYLDAYTDQGLGTGAEFDYSRAKDARGSLYAYQIKEGGANPRRWTVLGNLFQNAGPYNLQARGQAMSDPQFNSAYFRSNYFNITPDLHNSFAITRPTKWLTYRLSGERVDLIGPDGKTFVRDHQTFPHLDVNTVPLSLGRGWTLTGSNYVDRQFLASDGFDHNEAQSAWRAARPYLLGRHWSLVPRAFASETYKSEAFSTTATAPSPLTDVLTARYGAGALLRYATLHGHLDLDYNKQYRARPSSLAREREAADGGVESDHLSLTHFWRPSRLGYTRVSAGYDFRALPQLGLSGAQRFDPIRTEASISPAPKLNLALVDLFSVAKGTRSVTVQADYGEVGGDRAGLGFFTSASGIYILSHTASYGRGSWRLSGALRYQLDTNTNDFQPFDKLISLEKNFHDFETFWQLRVKQHDLEFGFRINLRYTYDRTAALSNMEAEREWYPWRSGQPVLR